MVRYRAMVSVFSAMLSAADPDTGEAIDGGTVAWSVSGGRGHGRQQLMRPGTVVGDPPLAVVCFGRAERWITDPDGGTHIARALGRTLRVTGPILPAGEYAIRASRVVMGVLESSDNFIARHRDADVLIVRETTNRRRTVRVFDVRMADGMDPDIALALMLLYGGANRQGILGELLDRS